MRYRGNFLTWSNRQGNRIWSKLDRVLINNKWVGEYPDFQAEFLNPGEALDHSTMVVSSLRQNYYRRKSFKFLNFLVQEEGFMTIVQVAWQCRVEANPMYVLMQK